MTNYEIGSRKPTAPNVRGYLMKLNHKASFLSAWNERYFRVNEDTLELEYFKVKPKSSKDVPSNTIHLDSIYEVMELDNFQFQLKTKGQDGEKGRDYLLQASNGSEYMSWMYELKYYVDRLNEYNEREEMLLTVASSSSRKMKSEELLSTAPSSTYSNFNGSYQSEQK